MTMNNENVGLALRWVTALASMLILALTSWTLSEVVAMKVDVAVLKRDLVQVERNRTAIEAVKDAQNLKVSNKAAGR